MTVFIFVGVVAVIGASAFLHRKGITRLQQRALLLAAVLLMGVAVVGAVTTPAQAANNRGHCDRWYQDPPSQPGGASRRSSSSLPAGTCREVGTEVWQSGNRLLGTGATNYRIGNRDVHRAVAAANRNGQNIGLAACAIVASRFPAGGAACVAVITLYWAQLESTFRTAHNQGKCVYIKSQGVFLREWYPTSC